MKKKKITKKEEKHIPQKYDDDYTVDLEFKTYRKLYRFGGGINNIGR